MPSCCPQTGTWCHIEIPTMSVERAKRFYGKVFGWTFQDVPQLNYTLYQTKEGGLGGGLFNPPPGIPRQIVNYLLVNEIEPALAQIEEHGGRTVTGKMQVPGAGWFALAADPDGNVFGIWKNAPVQAPAAIESPARRPARKPAAAKRSPTPRKRTDSKG